jgi:hypothetical protein
MTTTVLQEAIKLAHTCTGEFWHRLSVDERLPFISEVEERLGVKPRRYPVAAVASSS